MLHKTFDGAIELLEARVARLEQHCLHPLFHEPTTFENMKAWKPTTAVSETETPTTEE
jgi:hypothetical protein